MESGTHSRWAISGGEEIVRERTKVSCSSDLVDDDGKPTSEENSERDAENEALLGAIRWKEGAKGVTSPSEKHDG